MDVIEKRLDEIHPYRNNPRRNDAAVEKVARSIEEFGFKVPMVIDRDGTIVTGHTRYKAARRLGLETVPCVVADDLSEDELRAFRIADNRSQELATWDEGALYAELEELDGADVDMSWLDLDGNDDDEDDADGRAPDACIEQTYAISVTCSDEEDQRRKFEELTGLGLECKVVVI